MDEFNPLNAELNPICHLLALLGGATIVVVSRLRVKLVDLDLICCPCCVEFLPHPFPISCRVHHRNAHVPG